MLIQSIIKKSVITASLAITSMAFSQKMPISVLPSGHLVVGAEIDGKKGILF